MNKAYNICIFTSIKRQAKGWKWRGLWEGVCLTNRSGTPACSDHLSPSGPFSSCRRWDSPGCRGVRRDSVTGHQKHDQSLPTSSRSSVLFVCGVIVENCCNKSTVGLFYRKPEIIRYKFLHNSSWLIKVVLKRKIGKQSFWMKTLCT